ncbi:MAG: alcohol dehydrogenase catalytic domain-containing protein [bacterium]|nr:alcohol dehydrogenase catalytic domain-containing protein [bacterium]
MSSIPERMRALRLYDVDHLVVEEVEVPRPADGEILVRTRASGICSGDLMDWYVRRKAPLVLGHEPAGEVAAIGRGVEHLRLGDRVALHHHAPCFTCDLCERGAYVHCATWRRTRLVPGGISEYILVPRENLGDTLVVPADLPFAAASLVEPLACVVKSLRRGAVDAASRVLVIGLGAMGLLHVRLVAARGGYVCGVDFDGWRCERALALGAAAAWPPSDAAAVAERGPFEVVVAGPGSAQAWHAAIAACAPGGTVVLFTPTPDGVDISIDGCDLYLREVSLVPSYSAGPDDTREALRVLTEGVVRPEQIVTDWVDIDGAAEAYARMRAGGRTLKTIVEFP